MVTNNDRTDEIIRQNALLEEQNALLREQNKILQHTTPPASDEREIFVEDIDRDEMRSGFLVTSDRKRLWNVQINLLNEFARICKKHNLRWFAIGGTLLGAARHKGFIPWDDDVDVAMFRPEYEKFKAIVDEELKDNTYCHAWHWFNYRVETDLPSEHTDFSLPLISKEQVEKYPGWSPFFPVVRLLANRTTYVMNDTREHVFSNIFIDILPFDISPPFFGNSTAANAFKISQELLMAIMFPEQVRHAIKNNQRFLLSNKELNNFLALPHKLRALNFELYCLENFSRTEHICEHKFQLFTPGKRYYRTADFDEIIYLPFEKIEVPSPAGYDNFLKDNFGDWHKLVVTHTHVNEWSADVPFEEYHRKSFRFAQKK